MKKDSSHNKTKKRCKTLNLLILYAIDFYQRFISPLLGQNCRFYPSCSSYATILLRFDNIFFACVKIFIRILRCNPLFHGGFSPPHIYLSQHAFNSITGCLQIKCNLARPHVQQPQKTTYFFVNSNSCLLKLKKFYIISIHL